MDDVHLDGEKRTVTRVFLSYSRKDQDTAVAVRKALEERGVEVFRDLDDTLAGEEWWVRLTELISAADAIIFLLSPDSASSPMCSQEVDYAQGQGKRILSAVLAEVDWSAAPPGLSKIHSADLRRFHADPHTVEPLLAGLLTDIKWVREHTRLLERALRWQATDHRASELLVGAALEDAEQWVIAQPARGTAPSNLHLEYLKAGRDAATAETKRILRETEEQRRRVQEQRDEALRSQSMFLAQMSRQQADAGQHDLAIKLALHALPRRLDQPDRPWVQAAESALLEVFANQKFRFELGGPRPGMGADLKGARLSADSLRVALDYGTQAELWSLESGEMLRSVQSDDVHSYVEQMVFSPDSKQFFVSYVTMGEVRFGAQYGLGGETTVRGSLFDIVDAKTGAPVHRFQIEGHQHNDMAFSPRGKWLFLSTDVQGMTVATTTGEVSSNEKWAAKSVSLAPPYAQVMFSEDENRIALLTRAGVLAVIDLTKKTSVVLDTRLSDDSKAVFVGHEGATLWVASGTQVASYPVGSSVDSASTRTKFSLPDAKPVLAFGFSTREESVAALAQDGRVHRWQEGEQRVDDGKIDVPALRSATLDESTQAALVEFEDGAVEYRELVGNTRAALLAADRRQLLTAAFSRDAQRVLLATSDNRVRIWDRAMLGAESGPQLVPAEPVTVVRFGSRSSQVVCGTPAGDVVLLDLGDGSRGWRGSPGHRGPVNSIALGCHGTRLVSGGADHGALIWDCSGSAPPMRLDGHQQDVDACLFSPDGSIVVTGSRDSTFRVWDAATGQQRYVLEIPARYLDPIHNASIYPQAVFSPDGNKLITVTAGDGMVVTQPALVWEVASGRLVQALVHREGAIWDLQVTTDGNQVITASYDNTAVLWDLRTGRRVQTFTGNTSRVLRAIPIDHGRLLVTATAEGVVRVYRVATGQLVHHWQVPATLSNVSVSHNERLLALGSNMEENGAHIEIWDPIIGVPLTTRDLPGHTLRALAGLAFDPDDDSLLAHTETNELFVLRLPPTGQPLIDQAWARVAGPSGELLTHEQRVRFSLASP